MLQQVLRVRRRRHLAVQQGVERPVLAVKGVDVAIVLANHRSAQRNAEKQAARARVRQDLGAHRQIGSGLGIASHRSGGGRGVGAQLELALQQVLHAVVGANDQHQVAGLSAGLESKAAAFDAEEGRACSIRWRCGRWRRPCRNWRRR